MRTLATAGRLSALAFTVVAATTLATVQSTPAAAQAAGTSMTTPSGLKIEDNHALVWLNPMDFILRARHEAQAWAVAAWLRRRA